MLSQRELLERNWVDLRDPPSIRCLWAAPPRLANLNEIIREYKKFSQLGLAIAGNFRLALKSSFLVRTKDRFAQRPTYRFTLSSKEKFDNLQMVGFEDGF